MCVHINRDADKLGQAAGMCMCLESFINRFAGVRDKSMAPYALFCGRKTIDLSLAAHKKSNEGGQRERRKYVLQSCPIHFSTSQNRQRSNAERCVCMWDGERNYSARHHVTLTHKPFGLQSTHNSHFFLKKIVSRKIKGNKFSEWWGEREEKFHAHSRGREVHRKNKKVGRTDKYFGVAPMVTELQYVFVVRDLPQKTTSTPTI